jgi:predicted hydrocarbon binding protein
MAEITLLIPEEVYQKMKEHKGVEWSEVVRDAIMDYIYRLEERKLEVTTAELLEELGEEFAEDLAKISMEEAVKSYEKMREKKWKRFYTIQAV